MSELSRFTHFVAQVCAEEAFTPYLCHACCKRQCNTAFHTKVIRMHVEEVSMAISFPLCYLAEVWTSINAEIT